MNTTSLGRDRLERTKAAYTTRRVPRPRMRTLVDDRSPRLGDVLLARVAEIGYQQGLEHHGGRKATLFTGDEILVCYGHRYAPDQFEAQIPSDLGTCHLVAQGGVASEMISKHASMKPPTTLEPIGLIGDSDGRPLNLRDYGLPSGLPAVARPRTIAVAGTSMNVGKTTSAANLIRGLSAAGLRVGAAKVTGTGAGKDIYLMADAGAFLALDFTDAGFPSTYLASATEIEQIVTDLTCHLAGAGADVVVLEVADGLYQRETAALLSTSFFAAAVDDVIFAAGDAMGAAAGVAWLRERHVPVRAVSGALTASPLAVQEAAAAIAMPVLTIDDLRNPAIAAMVGMTSLAA